MTPGIVPHPWGHECSALDRGVSHYLGTFPTAAEAEAAFMFHNIVSPRVNGRINGPSASDVSIPPPEIPQKRA